MADEILRQVVWIHWKEEGSSIILYDKVRLSSNHEISRDIRECRYPTTEFWNSQTWIINLFSLTEMRNTEDEDVEMSSERVIYLHFFNQF